MTFTYTQLTSQDKGKILTYTETLNATQIAKKWNEILLQYVGLLPNELKTALSEELSKFDVSILRSVVDSMSQRIEVALNAKRRPTKY
ncbi:4463_t:CDS:2 [Diversispora eburnea]|uniref:4463_t:CDS:1 n=1 Tax=Diversispora eburnea TaxID=1213867 RepID=A0A9N9CNR7_9GLOM|nr:4463_t:CDS:2 [Diversispora eburnea]